MRTKQNSILLILILCSFYSYAQGNDFQFWSSLSANDKVTYKTDIFVKNGIRFRENATLLSKVFSEIKLKYKYNKKMYFSIGFRDINEWDNQLNRQQKNRYFIDLGFNKKEDRFRFSLRNRYQNQGNSIINYSYIFRQKLSVKYNIRKTKLDPVIASEIFYTNQLKVNKLRYIFGISIPINKDLDFDMSYLIQKQLNEPGSLFIIDGKLAYAF